MNMSISRAVVSATVGLIGVVGAGSVIAQAAGDVTPAPVGLQTIDDATDSGERGCHRGEAIAEALGITTDELDAAREAGTSIAEIADAQGVALDDVVAAIVDAKVERLDAKVAAGDLTEAEAAERLAAAEERALEQVSGDS